MSQDIVAEVLVTASCWRAVGGDSGAAALVLMVVAGLGVPRPGTVSGPTGVTWGKGEVGVVECRLVPQTD